MSIHRKLTTVCCAAMLALGLAACGSSSDDNTSLTDTTPTTPTTISPMEPTAAEQLANAQAAVTDAQTKVETLTAASSNSDRAAAYAALAGAQSALAEASDIPENEIALLKTEIARLQGVIDKAAMDAQTEADRIAAEMTAEADRIAALVAGTASAETKRTAIKAEADQPAADDAGLGGSMATTDDDVYSFTIERDRTDTTIKIDVDPMAAEDDPKFMQAMDLGNGRTMHVREMEADDDGDVVTEVVIVATDIAAPKAVAFAKFEDNMEMTTQVPGVNEKTTGEGDFQSLTAAKVSENPSLVKSAGFSASAKATLDFTGAALEEDDADDADVKAGTYNGAPGTYRCVIADCTVMISDKGAVEGLTGWIFTPNAGATSDQPDYDYLHYGFWLQKTADADGATTYNEVETFAGSSVDPSGVVMAVTGSATYEGGATGVYVHSEVNSDGSRVATTAGQFAADASLTATFGQVNVDGSDPLVGTIAPNLLYTVTGSIANFALEHGEANTWAVNLKGDIQPDGGDGGTASGTANGGGPEGSFSATFHGSVVAVDEVVPQPSSVVGEFNANFSNGSAVGAFGARK